MPTIIRDKFFLLNKKKLWKKQSTISVWNLTICSSGCRPTRKATGT